MEKKRVLIVEDERIVADDIKMSLQKLGYEVCGIAISGEEALKKIEELHPDLVLMDIVLEGEMDGIEASSIVRSRFDIPVIYLTAHADPNTLERAKITEPLGYILKPYDDRNIHSSIEMAFYKHKMTGMLIESEERYRSVVENAHDAIYILTSGSFQYTNPEFERLTGYTAEELCQNEFNFWNIVHPEDAKTINEESKQTGKNALHNHIFRIIAKDKGVKIVEANTVSIGKTEEVKEIGILRDITTRKEMEEKLKRSLEKLQHTFEKTIDALVSALERRDPYTAGHQKRVATLACAIAEEMGLLAKNIEGIRMAGLTHDVGKIQIPTEILIKPDQLSDMEFGMIKTHPQVGFDILKEIDFPYPVSQIILQHHERVNGSGYPNKLSGESILLEARILAVADVVEAMSSHRPYRPALGIETALEEISKNRGVFYDARAVDACMKLFQEKNFKLESEWT